MIAERSARPPAKVSNVSLAKAKRNTANLVAFAALAGHGLMFGFSRTSHDQNLSVGDAARLGQDLDIDSARQSLAQPRASYFSIDSLYS